MNYPNSALLWGTSDANRTWVAPTDRHDGASAIDLRLTAGRVVCQNTLALLRAQRDLPICAPVDVGTKEIKEVNQCFSHVLGGLCGT